MSVTATITASECAAPPDSAGVEWALYAACSTVGRCVPQIVWCAPENERERAYVARWGRDWPAAPVQLAKLDGNTLWLRSDRLEQITDQIIFDLIARTN